MMTLLEALQQMQAEVEANKDPRDIIGYVASELAGIQHEAAYAHNRDACLIICLMDYTLSGDVLRAIHSAFYQGLAMGIEVGRRMEKSDVPLPR